MGHSRQRQAAQQWFRTVFRDIRYRARDGEGDMGLVDHHALLPGSAALIAESLTILADAVVEGAHEIASAIKEHGKATRQASAMHVRGTRTSDGC